MYNLWPHHLLLVSSLNLVICNIVGWSRSTERLPLASSSSLPQTPADCRHLHVPFWEDTASGRIHIQRARANQPTRRRRPCCPAERQTAPPARPPARRTGAFRSGMRKKKKRTQSRSRDEPHRLCMYPGDD
ncbi:unnamed protein product [Protopolystoma xenopodis]|uniref:Secreted protein n=1 Tax=Protopolystoma xenopodis TaxID=117903 RepID=A0A448WQS8_9PLAT|nr:unnamed protein product [Protopolystoma xenopodis]